MAFGSSQQVRDELQYTDDDVTIPIRFSATGKLTNGPRKQMRRELGNSFYLDHITLSYTRDGYDDEPDCSNNGRYGTWVGTGVTSGSQYVPTGYRLSSGSFQGDRAITTSSTLEATGIYITIKPTSFSQHLLNLNATDYITIDSSGYIQTNNFSTVRLYRTDTETNAPAVIGEWKSFVIIPDPFTISDHFTQVELGRVGSNYFVGEIDELIMGDVDGSSKYLQFDNKTLDTSSSVYAGLELWWSMDNPILGDNRDAPALYSVTNYNNTFIDPLQTNEYIDLTNSSGTLVSTGYLITSGQTLQSEYVYFDYNDVARITQVTVDVTPALTADHALSVSFDGSTFNTITPSSQTTVSSSLQGSSIKYKITSNTTTAHTITRVQVTYGGINV